MPQELSFPAKFSVRDLLVYVAWLKRVPRTSRTAEVERVLRLADLVGVADKRVSKLSGGTRRRLGLAQAVLGRPRLVLLDEPTAGLDLDQCVRLRGHIRAMTDVGMVVATHQAADAAAIADTVMVFHDQRVLFAGPLEELTTLGAPAVGVAALEQGYLSLLHPDGSRA